MKPLLTVLLVLIFCLCFSQKNNDSLYFEKLGSSLIQLNFSKKTITKIPFFQTRILDARPDTTSLGFFSYRFVENAKKLRFSSSLSDEITEFVSKNYITDTSSSNVLLVIIKEYRISDYARDVNSNSLTVQQLKDAVIVNAELFLQNKDKYHALYKIDTVLVNDSAISLNTLIQKSFAVLFNKASDKNITDLHIGKTEFSYADIQQHIESFFNYPVLKDSALKRGAYKNFEEFKSNNPSIRNYYIQSGRLSDEIFITENNQAYPLQNFWGYCDGKTIFIRSAGNLFPLIKTGNTYNVRAAKYVTVNEKMGKGYLSNPTSNGALLMTALDLYASTLKDKIKLSAFQLNMQNGELY